MALYYTNELTFDLPEPLIDKTHHIFSLTQEGPSEFNLVISRHPIKQGETLPSYGDRLVTEMEKTLPQFELLAKNDIIVAKHSALKLSYSWVQQGQVLHQIQVSFFYCPIPSQQQIIQITATTLNKFSNEWEQTFVKLLDSVRLRQEATFSQTNLQ